jgi:S-adenosylmethionine decarboxylase proenzyme
MTLMRALGQHTLLDFYGCDEARLTGARAVKALLCRVVREGAGTIVKAVFHNFSPHGVSGVLVITESHVTIHTWPEHGYAAVDIFSCGTKLDHAVIRAQLKRALGALRAKGCTVRRGLKGNRRKRARE